MRDFIVDNISTEYVNNLISLYKPLRFKIHLYIFLSESKFIDEIINTIFKFRLLI